MAPFTWANTCPFGALTNCKSISTLEGAFTLPKCQVVNIHKLRLFMQLFIFITVTRTYDKQLFSVHKRCDHLPNEYLLICQLIAFYTGQLLGISVPTKPGF